MSRVKTISIEVIDGQKVIVKKYAARKPKGQVCKAKGWQTSDANLVYPWHRQYPKK